MLVTVMAPIPGVGGIIWAPSLRPQFRVMMSFTAGRTRGRC